jgi:hypothetical protein
MASQMRELKSILKPPRSSHTPQQKSQAEAEQIALAHARILQQQKDLELQILSAIDTLSTFPLTRSPSHYSAASPAPSDISSFKSLIRPFQPSDYDDLVEERNILGHCGYSLCPKPRRTDVGGRFTLVNHNRPDFAIVETKDVQKWCSDKCARRALYVKVQLNETAAWERVAMPEVRIDLLDEEPERGGAKDADVARDNAQLKLSEERKAKSDSAALSLERGDVLERGDERKSRQVPLGPKMELTIREKDVTKVARPPKREEADVGHGHLVLEGHKTRFGTREGESESEEGADSEEDAQDSGFG